MTDVRRLSNNSMYNMSENILEKLEEKQLHHIAYGM